MKLEALRGGMISSYEEFQQKMEDAIAELNRTKEAACWICGEFVHNWGVIFPKGGPDGLGLGVSTKDGKEMTRLAFFPFCKEHDLEDEEIVEIIQNKLISLHQQLSN